MGSPCRRTSRVGSARDADVVAEADVELGGRARSAARRGRQGRVERHLDEPAGAEVHAGRDVLQIAERLHVVRPDVRQRHVHGGRADHHVEAVRGPRLGLDVEAAVEGAHLHAVEHHGDRGRARDLHGGASSGEGEAGDARRRRRLDLAGQRVGDEVLELDQPVGGHLQVARDVRELSAEGHELERPAGQRDRSLGLGRLRRGVDVEAGVGVDASIELGEGRGDEGQQQLRAELLRRDHDAGRLRRVQRGHDRRPPVLARVRLRVDVPVVVLLEARRRVERVPVERGLHLRLPALDLADREPVERERRVRVRVVVQPIEREIAARLAAHLAVAEERQRAERHRVELGLGRCRPRDGRPAEPREQVARLRVGVRVRVEDDAVPVGPLRFASACAPS